MAFWGYFVVFLQKFCRCVRGLTTTPLQYHNNVTLQNPNAPYRHHHEKGIARAQASILCWEGQSIPCEGQWVVGHYTFTARMGCKPRVHDNGLCMTRVIPTPCRTLKENHRCLTTHLPAPAPLPSPRPLRSWPAD